MMTDTSDPTGGLRRVVESTRVALFPDLDPVLVREILDVQVQYAEDRTEAEKQTEQVVSRWVAAHPVPAEGDAEDADA